MKTNEDSVQPMYNYYDLQRMKYEYEYNIRSFHLKCIFV